MLTPTGKTILVVDDNKDVRDDLATVLRDAGYPVVALRNGRETLDYLREHLPPGLILLDMMMPEYDGWLFLRGRYRNPALAAVPVLIMTAIGVASPEWAVSLGAEGLLHKPFDMERLLQEVKGHLEAQPAGAREPSQPRCG